MSQRIKKRRFLLDASAAVTTIDTAITRLQQVPGILAVNKSEPQIEIEYDLAVSDYLTVRHALQQLLPLAPERGLGKLKANWLAVTESNQRSYLALPAGWTHHVQNLYLALSPGDKR